MESKKYMTFNDELQVMSQYINTAEVASRLDISDAQTTQMEAYKTRFEAEMNLYRNPATRTAVITNQIADTYKTILAWVKDFRQAIKHGKKDELNEQDYASLFIHKDKAYHRHTVPDTAPTLELEHIEHLNARVSAHHHTTHNKGTRPTLPEGVDILDWEWVVIDEQQIVASFLTDSAIHSNHLSTRSASLKLEFTPEQVGKFCHIVGRYGINNGKTGTISETLIFAIT